MPPGTTTTRSSHADSDTRTLDVRIGEQVYVGGLGTIHILWAEGSAVTFGLDASHAVLTAISRTPEMPTEPIKRRAAGSDCKSSFVAFTVNRGPPGSPLESKIPSQLLHRFQEGELTTQICRAINGVWRSPTRTKGFGPALAAFGRHFDSFVAKFSNLQLCYLEFASSANHERRPTINKIVNRMSAAPRRVA